MIIWFALIIPVITALALVLGFKKKVVWWEYLVPVLATAMVIWLLRGIGVWSTTIDTEYWGAHVISSTYYEAWDEKVSCTHAKYRTETRINSDGTTTTSQVFDGWEHLYDVDYHPPYWEIYDSLGRNFTISQSEHECLSIKFRNSEFKELHRDYHNVDGDAYVSRWDGNWATLEPVTTSHTYINKVQNSDSVFNYPIVRNKKGLYEYVYNGIFNTPSVLPSSVPNSDEISKLNATMGATHEIRVWVLVYFNESRSTAFRQEALWKNGNMNELVICVGVDKNYNIDWAQVFSWTKNEEIKVEIREYLEKCEKLSLKDFRPVLEEQIKKNWKRRDFKEFDYLYVADPLWAVITAYLVSIVLCATLAVFAVTNDFSMKIEHEGK